MLMHVESKCACLSSLWPSCLFFVLFCGLCFQLSSLQEVIQEKEALLEEQVRQHQAELLKIVAQSDLEAETQQVYLI